jgi:hypothetical protein
MVIKLKIMKNYHILIICLCLFLASCGLAAPTYFGDKLTPTTNVDVFYSAHDVTRQYKVIGHLTYGYGGSQDAIKAKFVSYAQKVGADAVVITGSTVDINGKAGETDVVNADALKYTN